MKVIALSGKSGIGKSETLKFLIEEIANNYVKVIKFGRLHPYSRKDKEEERNDYFSIAKQATTFKGDVYAIFEIKNKYIGIMTQGDTKEYLKEGYYTIHKVLEENESMKGLDFFVCAIHNYGGTREFLEELEDVEVILIYGKVTMDFMYGGINELLEKERCNINKIQAKFLYDSLMKNLKEFGYGNH